MKLFFAIIFCINFSALISQNLLIDGSFEESNLSLTNTWSVLGNSPDLFIPDLDKVNMRTFARKGNKAHSGNNYLGLYLGYESEFIVGKLKSPLVKEQIYDVRMYVQLNATAIDCDKKFSYISVGFVDTVPIVPESKFGVSLNYFFSPLTSTKEVIDNSETWEEIAGKYKAKGGEEFLLLGNFRGANFDVTKKCGHQYYYFDDIEVIEQRNNHEIKVNQPFYLQNILFESGKSNILPIAYVELDKLVLYLKGRNNLRLQISGHTDNIGRSEDNQILSEQRAKSLNDYLVNAGINQNRIIWNGHGESMPVYSNISIEGQQKNRRVEFLILAE